MKTAPRDDSPPETLAPSPVPAATPKRTGLTSPQFSVVSGGLACIAAAGIVAAGIVAALVPQLLRTRVPALHEAS